MSMLIALGCVALLAYVNGANDNFKGVATLFGSGVANYRQALGWATAATLAGCVAAIFLTAQLVATFSGKLFVSAGTLALPGFPLAVCGACAATVWIATRLGLPISTTHALAGGLLGAALAAPQSVINWTAAGKMIFLPLAVGPLIAVASAVMLYPLFALARRNLQVSRESCVCVGEQIIVAADGAAATALRLELGNNATCRERYSGSVAGVDVGRALDGLHYLSAGLVSFARGVNDTPKIVALILLATPLWQGGAVFIAVGLVMAWGGWLSAQRVAETMAHKITALSPGQGCIANLVTSLLVLAASPLGLPLSTTHVSCGALFGIGTVTGQARWKMIGTILGAWLITLPLAAVIGAGLMLLLPSS